MKIDMSYSLIPDLKGRRAARHWLRNLASGRLQRKRSHYEKCVRMLERKFDTDAEALKRLREIIEDARFFGRVEGLREGLQLHEYGTRIQEKRSDAFRAMMKFIVRKAEKLEGEALAQAISAKLICEHLDKEMRRIRNYGTSTTNLQPPDGWGCQTWSESLKSKRVNVDSLVFEAKGEALSQMYCTLMAWKTWGHTRTNKNERHLSGHGE